MTEKTDILVLNARNKNFTVNQRHLAFSELVNRFYGTAYGWAMSILADRHLAQDATQEAFVSAFQQLEQLRDPIAFAGWLRQIVQNQAYRLVRQQAPEVASVEGVVDVATSDPEPALLIEKAELKERVMTAVQALPENEQLVTQLFYLNGYSQSEIARLLGLPLTTVKKRLQYARRNLKGILFSMVDTFVPPPPAKPVLATIPAQKSTPSSRR